MLHQTQRYPFPFPSSPKLLSSSLVEKGGGMGRMVKGGCLASKMIMEDVFSNLPPQASSSSPSSVVVAAGEDFFVDQLLNFNENDEIDLPQTPEHQKPQQQLQQEALVVQQQLQQEVNEDKDASFLSPPLDTAEEADLEWLSQFVDDTGCPYSSPFPPGYVKPEPEPKPEVNARVGEAAPLSLRRARRKKRARTGGRVWVDDSFPYYMPPPKKGPAQKSLVHKPVKNKEIWSSDSGPADPVQQQLRRCSHCGVQKTPQWRAGPNGSKTLCNACGVRYKSGRLLPEYRPAISPTFSSELHSNSHRKVLEMRMKKGGRGPGSPDSGQTRLFRPVSSFG